MLEALLANADIHDRFERVVSVGTVRAFKPSPSTYRLACEAWDCHRRKCCLSNGFDLHGGARFGLQTARIERNTAHALRATIGVQASDCRRFT
jgi:2-haloacid dehalogenase